MLDMHGQDSSNQPVSVDVDVKCIKAEVGNLKTMCGTLEKEILKLVSQLCEENVQLKENTFEEELKALHTENGRLTKMLHKCENSEEESRKQIMNLKEKNSKLNLECEHLRDNIKRRRDKSMEYENILQAKDEEIKKLQTEVREVRKESAKKQSVIDADSIITEDKSEVTVSTSNRFEQREEASRGNSTTRSPEALYFNGHLDPLSKFYRLNLSWNRQRFHSVKRAFQFEKAVRHGDHALAEKIMKSKHAGISNKLGRNVRIHPQWDNEKEGLMLELLRVKAKQCEKFREKLLESGDRELCDNVHDRFWGIGKDGRGMNVLGKLLMEIRRKQSKKADREKMKPSAVIIGSSLIKNLRGERLSSRVKTDVSISYTIPKAREKVKIVKSDTDVVVYQLLSNDVKRKSEKDCVEELASLVRITKQRCHKARIIISLPPNRGDSRNVNTKTDVVNASVKSMFEGDEIVSICDNSNLSFRGQPSRRFICRDGVHPTPEDERVLFANIRRAIEEVLSP